MEAMILAAGLGTRLEELTDDRPKALVEVSGKPMIQHVAERLIAVGVDHLVVNTHYHAEQVERFIDEQEGFGVEVSISPEPDEILGTGGGIYNARDLFREETPFFVHNTDIFSDIDLEALYDDHPQEALATLAVRPADTHRYLLVDEAKKLCGYGDPETGEPVETAEAEGEMHRVDFLGIQVVSPRIFPLITERGVFSSINAYLRLAREGHLIHLHEVGKVTWIDAGTPERLEKARIHFG